MLTCHCYKETERKLVVAVRLYYYWPNVRSIYILSRNSSVGGTLFQDISGHIDLVLDSYTEVISAGE